MYLSFPLPEAFVLSFFFSLSLLMTSAQYYGVILEKRLSTGIFFLPVIHTDVVALHYIENVLDI